MLVRQALCCLTTPPALFAVVILEMGVSLFAQASLDHHSPILSFLPLLG
jgi:hypothetical protein